MLTGINILRLTYDLWLASAGRAKWAFGPLWKLRLKDRKFSRNPEISNLMPIKWYLILAAMSLHSIRVPSPPLRQGAKVVSGLFCCWSVLHNNNIATNLQRFISWRFACLWLLNKVRNEVRWRPGQEASLAAPCSNLRSFGSKCTVLKNAFVTLLGLFGAPRSHSTLPAVIWRPHSDSAPGELCPPFSLRYAPCVERRLLVRQCSETVTADSGKPCTFMVCEKKHEWISSNVSTSLKNPLLVRLQPMA